MVPVEGCLIAWQLVLPTETPGPQPLSWGSKFPGPPASSWLPGLWQPTFQVMGLEPEAAGEGLVCREEGALLPDTLSALGSLPSRPSLRGLCTESDSGEPRLVRAEQTTTHTCGEAHELVHYLFLLGDLHPGSVIQHLCGGPLA